MPEVQQGNSPTPPPSGLKRRLFLQLLTAACVKKPNLASDISATASSLTNTSTKLPLLTGFFSDNSIASSIMRFHECSLAIRFHQITAVGGNFKKEKIRLLGNLAKSFLEISSSPQELQVLTNEDLQISTAEASVAIVEHLGVKPNPVDHVFINLLSDRITGICGKYLEGLKNLTVYGPRALSGTPLPGFIQAIESINKGGPTALIKTVKNGSDIQNVCQYLDTVQDLVCNQEWNFIKDPELGNALNKIKQLVGLRDKLPAEARKNLAFAEELLKEDLGRIIKSAPQKIQYNYNNHEKISEEISECLQAIKKLRARHWKSEGFVITKPAIESLKKHVAEKQELMRTIHSNIRILEGGKEKLAEALNFF